jgi:hypothetical protein
MSRQSTTRQPVAMTAPLTRAITMKVMKAMKARGTTPRTQLRFGVIRRS